MLLILAVPAVLLHLYAGWKLGNAIGRVASVPVKRARRTVFLVQAYLILYPLLSLLGFFVEPEYVVLSILGAYEGPDLLLAYPFWVGFITVVQLLPLLLVSDLGRFVLVRFFRINRERWLLLQGRMLLVLAALILGYVTARVIADTFLVRVSTRDYFVGDLPPALEGLRIVHLADLQMDDRTGAAKVSRYIDAVNALKPDLVCFSGDLITTGTKYIDRAADAFGRIKSKYGVYAVLGDHDYWAGARDVDHALTKNGIRVLTDENYVVNIEGDSIAISAVTNVYQRRPGAETLQSLAGTRGHHPLSILLTHQPSQPLTKFAKNQGYHLFLGGHTHGGQIRPGYGSLNWTFSNLETPFVSGFFEIGSMLVSVNNGLGLTFAPLRFQAPAEVTLITLGRSSLDGSPSPSD